MWYFTTETAKLKLLAGRPGSPGSVDGTGTAARFNGADLVEMSPDGRIANLAEPGTCRVRQVSKGGQVATIGSLNGCSN